MKTNRKINNKGFTLVELIVVIAIIGILVAIAVPRMTNTLDAAYYATLETNMKHVETVVLLHMMDLDDEHIYTMCDGEDKIIKPNGEQGDKADNASNYLSRQLEVYLEKKAANNNEYSKYSNHDAYRNAISGREAVVNWNKFEGKEDFWQQAIYLTSKESYSYGSSTSKENLLKYVGGAVIVYFNQTDQKLEIYYVDQDGVKSDHCTTY